MLALVESLYKADPRAVSAVLETEWDVLEACAIRYPETGRSLRALLALPFAPAASAAPSDASEDSAAYATTALENLRPFYARAEPAMEFTSINGIIGRLERARETGNEEDLEAALSEAEARTGGAGEGRLGSGRLISWLLGQLLPLLHWESGKVREQSLRLLIRYLGQAPQHSRLFLPALRACLEDADSGVGDSLRAFLGELASLSRDGAPQLVTAAVESRAAGIRDSQTRSLVAAALDLPVPS